MSADPNAEGGNMQNIYKVGPEHLPPADGARRHRLLVAAAAPGGDRAGEARPASTGKDKAFYEGKVAAAQFFARTVLPKITAERAIAEATDLSLMELDESAF